MNKLVNGVRVSCSQQEENLIIQNRITSESEWVDIESVISERKKIGNAQDFLLNLCKFLEVQPESVRDWQQGDDTYKSLLDIDIGLFG